MVRIGLYEGFVGGHHDKYINQLLGYLLNEGEDADRLDAGTATRTASLCSWLNLIRSSFKWKNYDIVHLTYADPLVVPLMLVLMTRLRKPKLFMTIHWYSSVLNSGVEPVSLYRRAKWRAFTYCVKRSEAVFVHGGVCKSKLSDATRLDKFVEVPYGTDVQSSWDLEDTPVCAGSGRILFFGGLRKDKGIEYLADAVRLLDRDLEVVVAGVPQDYTREDILSIFEGLNTRLLLRYINEDEIPELFRSSELLVLPYRSVFGGQSGPLTMAATYGLPVVGTDVGEIGATIREFDIGEVCRPEDPCDLARAIENVLSYSEDRWEQIRRHAFRYAETHSWSEMGRRIRDAYYRYSSLA